MSVVMLTCSECDEETPLQFWEMSEVPGHRVCPMCGVLDMPSRWRDA